MVERAVVKQNSSNVANDFQCEAQDYGKREAQCLVFDPEEKVSNNPNSENSCIDGIPCYCWEVDETC